LAYLREEYSHRIFFNLVLDRLRRKFPLFKKLVDEKRLYAFADDIILRTENEDECKEVVKMFESF